MAIIGKIRDNGWLVLIVIGVALVAFIMGDWSKMTGADEPKYGLGTIYGEKVDFDDFNEAVALAEENTRKAAAQQQQQPQPVDQTAVWRQFVEKLLLEKEYEALGIDVSETEFDAYLYGTDGFTVLPDLEKNFIDSTTKAFNPKLLQARIDEMQASDDPEIVKGWEDSKEYYTEKRKQEKYFDVLGQGMYSTSLEAKNEYFAKNEVKNISYVIKRYREIKEGEFDPSEKTLKAYYEKHKSDKKYQVKDASKKVHYFDIPIEPSSSDITEFNRKLDAQRDRFAVTTNDSLFVLKESDFKFFTSTAFSTALPKTHPNAQNQYITYPADQDSKFEAAVLGDIVGPYDNEGATAYAKVIGFTSDTINARHILISIQQGEEVAKQAIADSIMANINDDNFVSFVKQFSDDEGSKVKDGDLGDFFYAQMVQPFAAYVADKPIGEIGQVRSQYGIHIVQVTGRRGRLYPRLVVLQKTLKPSLKTMEATDSLAYSLLYMLDEKLSNIKDPNKKVVKFDTLVSRAKYRTQPVQLLDNAPVTYGFTTKYAEDKILELAYTEEQEVGTLVGSPIKDKNKHVIAIYAGSQGTGEPSYEEIKDALKQAYIQEQTVKRFKSEMRSKSLSSIAGTTPQKAEVTLANPQITGAGMEPDVVGAIFAGLKDGERTLPIEGKSGVFVVKLDKTTKAPQTKDYVVEQQQLLAGMRGSLQSEAKRALTKLADVVDNRRLFNINVRR
ncbi:MAG: peptidyl-prolyl cis-trans isomerase D [Crocinitomicaceae bacterium]|jgi:peptidyl-prolyl cis-trans isomerase D